MNKVILVGRLTGDPVTRSSSNGTNFCTFSIAVNRNYKNKDGKYDADFFNCIANRNADFISKYFSKGSLIGIEGRIQNRSYIAADNSNRTATEIVVDNAEFVGSKADSASNVSYSKETVDAPSVDPIDVPSIDVSSADPFSYDNEVSLSDNDLPF